MKHPRLYIPAAALGNEPFGFAWDEWALLPYYHHDDYGRYDEIAPLSLRAQLSLTVATAEWVLARMRADQTGTDIEEFVEAAWAGAVSPSYCVYTEPEDDDWRGVQLGPLHIVILVLNDAIQLLHSDPDGATRAVWMFNLMTHLCAQPEPFHDWFDAVVGRLRQHHPRPPSDPSDLFSQLPPGMGPPVPPEAFDLARPYDPNADPALINVLLQNLDWRRNPYLQPPADVAASPEFEGTTPYQYP